MTGGWLEHEIRSLPQVLACSIEQDDIVVLVQPSADPVAVERAVTAVLVKAGVDLPVRVFGGARPVFVEPAKIRNGRPALVGSIGGALILAAGMWIAGATTGLRGNGTSARSKAPLALLAPPLAKELVTVGGGGAAPVAEPPVQPPVEPAPPPLLRQPRTPIFSGGGNGHTGAGNGHGGGGGGGGPTPAPEVEECNAPHAGQTPKEFTGQGAGPPSWSHSIHVPAHCEHGKP